MDIITYALCKKLIGQASSSIKDIKYNSSTKSLVFTTETGSFSVPVPVPADGVGVKNIYFNDGGDLVFEYTDGTTTNVGNIFQGTTDIEEIELYPDFTEEDEGSVLTVKDNSLVWEKQQGGSGTNYSYTEEVLTGKWIDGRGVYTAVVPYEINNQVIPAGESVALANNAIPNIDILLNVRFVSDMGNMTIIPVQYSGGNHYITLNNNTSVSYTIDYATHVIIEYVK